MRTPLTPERQDLVETWIGEARKIAAQAARRAPRCVPYADIYSAALGGLVEAAADYDPGPSDRPPRAFPPFAHWRMRGAIRDYLRGLDFFPGRRRAGAAVAQSSLDDPARADGVSVGASLPSGDAEGAILADRAEAIEDARERILGILEYLPDNHAGTLLDWLECPSGADCARRLGLSEATIFLRRRNALDAAKRASARRIDR